MSLALIDADSIIYKIACQVENRYLIFKFNDERENHRFEVNDLRVAKKEVEERGWEDQGEIIRKVSYPPNVVEIIYLNLNSKVKQIEHDVLGKVDGIVYYIGEIDGSNFRYKIDPNYKAGRERPAYYWQTRHYLQGRVHNLKVIRGKEAEDAIADDYSPEDLIGHIDKDLDQLIGQHYNYDKGTFYEISEEQAIRNLWRQIILGDWSCDNVPGMKGFLHFPCKKDPSKNKGYGPETFEKDFAECVTYYDFKNRAQEWWVKNGGKDPYDHGEDNDFTEVWLKQERLVKLGGPYE